MEGTVSFNGLMFVCRLCCPFPDTKTAACCPTGTQFCGIQRRLGVPLCLDYKLEPIQVEYNLKPFPFTVNCTPYDAH